MAAAALCEALQDRCRGRLPPRGGPHQLLDCVDNVVLAWTAAHGCLLTQLVDGSSSSVQTVVLSRPPVWEVERVLVNRSGSYVALVGSRGVALVCLPPRCGNPPLFDHGRPSMTCRAEYVGERFFSCHPKLVVVQAAWHPGSLQDCHLVLLTSDNCLRIYNASCVELAEQCLSVGPDRVGVVNSVACGSTLGHNAVAFDFSLPRQPADPPACPAAPHSPGNPVSSGFMASLVEQEEEGAKQQFVTLQWPVFVLYGNGDVCYTTTVVAAGSRPMVRPLYGPLTMTPACDDNFGLDWCGLMVVQTCPPVLVLATTASTLHHCVLLHHPHPHPPPQHPLLQTGQGQRVPAEARLHVYESVELDLTQPLDQQPPTPGSSLLLLSDPSTPSRYLVSHETGIHVVTLPLVESLLQHCDLPDEAWLGEECACHVEHLLCTRGAAPAAHTPLVGVGTGARGRLYARLATGRIVTVPLPLAVLPPIPEPLTLDLDPLHSPLRKVHVNSNFESHVRGLLERATSVPLLASGSSAPLPPSQCAAQLAQVTSLLHHHYLTPQKSAKQEVDKREEILKGQKQMLEEGLAELVAEQRQLTEAAHQLAEAYEEANDTKNQLIGRLERVLGRVLQGLPVLTTGERHMGRELDDMTAHLPSLNNQLSLIQDKIKWQANQMDLHNNNEASRQQQQQQQQPFSVSHTQVKALNQALAKEGEKLNGLLEKVNQVKRDLQL